jgi:hypothetical protein
VVFYLVWLIPTNPLNINFAYPLHQ